MVPQHYFRILSFCIFAVLIAPGNTNAQHYYPARIASVGSAPLEAMSNWNDGNQRNTPPGATYSQPPTAPYVAFQANPHVALQATPPNEAGPNAGAATSGELFTPYSPAFNATGCPSYGCGNGQCAQTQCYQPRPRANWYASAAGLYMERDKPSRVWTTYENNNNSNQLMNTQAVNPDWEGGADLRLGRFFACDRWALEFGYWSLNNFEANSSQTHANGVSSPLQFNDLEFAVGDPVVSYFDSAAEHRLYRSNELHNVEMNLIEGKSATAGCSPWSHRMLVGVRYFKFDEDLSFDTLDQGGTWGGNGGLDEVYLDDTTKNDLVGAQIGCIFQRQVGSRTKFFVTPKFGVYNNHISHRFDLRRGDGTAAMPSAFSGVSGSYPVESSTDVVSFLTEANIGLEYQASPLWTLFGGYRVVILTNVGLTDNQMPQFIVDIPEIADIDTDGSLVLQGAFFGATRRF